MRRLFDHKIIPQGAGQGVTNRAMSVSEECQPTRADMYLHQLDQYIEELRSELSDTVALREYVDQHELPDGVIELLEAQLHRVRYEEDRPRY